MDRLGFIRAAFAAGAFAWSLADGPARLWLPERRVLREADYLVRVVPWDGDPAFKGWPPKEPVTDLFVRRGEPQSYRKADFAPGCQWVFVRAWHFRDGARQEVLTDFGDPLRPVLDPIAWLLGPSNRMEITVEGERVFELTCG